MVDAEMLTYYKLNLLGWQQLPRWRQDKLREHWRDWKWRQDLQRKKKK